MTSSGLDKLFEKFYLSVSLIIAGGAFGLRNVTTLPLSLEPDNTGVRKQMNSRHHDVYGRFFYVNFGQFFR